MLDCVRSVGLQKQGRLSTWLESRKRTIQLRKLELSKSFCSRHQALEIVHESLVILSHSTVGRSCSMLCFFSLRPLISCAALFRLSWQRVGLLLVTLQLDHSIATPCRQLVDDSKTAPGWLRSGLEGCPSGSWTVGAAFQAVLSMCKHSSVTACVQQTGQDPMHRRKYELTRWHPSGRYYHHSRPAGQEAGA